MDLKALLQEFYASVLWEDFYADDLVIIAESIDECVRRFLTRYYKKLCNGRVSMPILVKLKT